MHKVLLASVTAVLAACAQMPSKTSEGQPVKPLAAARVGANSCGDSGSLIPRKSYEGASSSACRSFSGEDLKRTGMTSVAAALRMLDPSVR